MDPIDYVRLGIEQYLRELPDAEFDDLLQRVRPPEDEPAGSNTAAFVRKVVSGRAN